MPFVLLMTGTSKKSDRTGRLASLGGTSLPSTPVHHESQPSSPAVWQSQQGEKVSELSHCTFYTCFNIKRCPLDKPFAVYVYKFYIFPSRRVVDLLSELVTSLEMTGSYTSDPDEACVFVGVIWNSGEGSPRNLQSNIKSLDHWGADGENHILIELSTDRATASLLDGVSTDKAIVARTFISPSRPFSSGFDILLPPIPTVEIGLRDLPPLLPVSRENFVYFYGELVAPLHPSSISITPTDITHLQQTLERREKVDIKLQCSTSAASQGIHGGQWTLCEDQKSRLELGSKSMFSLVPRPAGIRTEMGVSVYTRLIESLMSGSIPVVIGVEKLPFDEVIDWRQATISVPPGRFPDLDRILHSIIDTDIQNLRLHGRNLWYNYFSSPLTVLRSAVNIVRSWTLHPPPFAPDFAGESLLSRGISSSYLRIRSPLFSHNFTTYSSSFWNSVPGPHFSYPNTPFTPGPFSGYQFSDLDEESASLLHSHVVGGKVVTGTTFRRNLLGNSPEEQFTIILLTYKRNKVLAEVLEKLKNVPFLNKLIVVWNNEENIPPMMWPNIGVPIEVCQLVILDL